MGGFGDSQARSSIATLALRRRPPQGPAPVQGDVTSPDPAARAAKAMMYAEYARYYQAQLFQATSRRGRSGTVSSSSAPAQAGPASRRQFPRPVRPGDRHVACSRPQRELPVPAHLRTLGGGRATMREHRNAFVDGPTRLAAVAWACSPPTPWPRRRRRCSTPADGGFVAGDEGMDRPGAIRWSRSPAFARPPEFPSTGSVQSPSCWRARSSRLLQPASSWPAATCSSARSPASTRLRGGDRDGAVGSGRGRSSTGLLLGAT